MRTLSSREVTFNLYANFQLVERDIVTAVNCYTNCVIALSPVVKSTITLLETRLGNAHE